VDVARLSSPGFKSPTCFYWRLSCDCMQPNTPDRVMAPPCHCMVVSSRPAVAEKTRNHACVWFSLFSQVQPQRTPRVERLERLSGHSDLVPYADCPSRQAKWSLLGHSVITRHADWQWLNDSAMRIAARNPTIWLSEAVMHGTDDWSPDPHWCLSPPLLEPGLRIPCLQILR
jgi:hypothetical protein